MKTEKIGPPSLSKFVFYVTANLPGRLRDIQQNVKISIFCHFGRDKIPKMDKMTPFLIAYDTAQRSLSKLLLISSPYLLPFRRR